MGAAYVNLRNLAIIGVESEEDPFASCTLGVPREIFPSLIITSWSPNSNLI